jgi:hypothetical protein
MTLSHPIIEDVSRGVGCVVRTFGLLGAVTLVGAEDVFFAGAGVDADPELPLATDLVTESAAG